MALVGVERPKTSLHTTQNSMGHHPTRAVNNSMSVNVAQSAVGQYNSNQKKLHETQRVQSSNPNQNFDSTFQTTSMNSTVKK
mmetsp:Transcript_39812/g.29372  ORF Transcript_39812/g.29372 Transcript_39812/m.29372 type:complete len:82 (+) Transcript_39812:208-453(+)